MCGLFGFSGQQADPLAIKLGLLVNESRGRHSTGVYGVDLFKEAKAAEDFVFNPSVTDAIGNASAVIGHTRFATMGEHNADNAHPYLLEHDGQQIVGTHNGFLIEQSVARAKQEFSYLTDLPVDSMTIFELLIKSGWDYQTLSRLDGAMALAFIDNDGLLNIYRRQSRPLFFGMKGDDLYYSSLENALDLIDVEDTWEVPLNTLMKFDKGVMTDAFKINDPDIINIPLDCSPSSWRTNLNAEERTVYPYSSGTSWNGRSYRQSDMYDEYDEYGRWPSHGAGCGYNSSANNDSSATTSDKRNRYTLAELMDMSPDEIKELFEKTETLMGKQFEETPILLKALQTRVLDVFESIDLLEDQRVEESSEDNGMNDMCIINLKLVNYSLNPMSDYYIALEEFPTIDGITTAEGEVVLPIPRSTGLTNSVPIVLQAQSLYTNNDFRIPLTLKYRKTIEAEAIIPVVDFKIETQDKKIRNFIEDLPVDDLPWRNNDRGSEDSDQDLTQVLQLEEKELYGEFVREHQELIGKQSVPYWRGLQFNSPADYEGAFFKWMKEHEKITGFPGYKGPERNSTGGWKYSKEFYDRVNYVNDNLKWEEMRHFERELRMKFGKYRRRQVVESLLGEFKDDVELLSTVGIARMNTNDVEYLQELLDQGEDIKEMCDVVSMDFDSKYASSITNYIDELLEVVQRFYKTAESV